MQIRDHAKGWFKNLASSQLNRNMASGVVASLVSAIAALLGYPIYTHFLGLEIYGVWLVLATFMQLALLGDLGISHALTKLVAEEHGRENQTEIQQYFTTAIILIGFSGLVIQAVIFVITPGIASLFQLSHAHASMISQLLPLVGLLTAYALLCQIYQATLSGLGRMDLAQYIQAIGRVVGVVVSVALVAMGGRLIAMLLGVAATCLFTHVAFAWALKREGEIKLLLKKMPCKRHVKKILCFGGGLFSASLIKQLLNVFNKVLLCRFCGVGSVPIYEIAFSCSQQMRSFTEVALRAMMPEVSRVNAQSKEVANRVRRLDRRAFKFILAISGPGYLVAFLTFRPLLALWLGHSLADSLSPVLAVLLFGSFISLMSVPSYYILIGMGQIRSIFFANVVLIGTNILASVVILLYTATITPQSMAWCVMLAMSTTCAYLITRKRRLLEKTAFQAPPNHPSPQALMDTAA